MNLPIDLPRLRRLYAAADQFKEMAPWQWMYDSDLFAVQNPADGIVGYCSVMGAAGEHFALGVYVGTAGLNSFYAVAEKAEMGQMDDFDTAFSQYCLMASFEDRNTLAPEDRAVIKKLGLQYRGAHNWPQFRSYRPGYFPWFITPEEADFLTEALEQARDVCPRVKEDENILLPKGEETEAYLLRKRQKSGKRVVWQDAVVIPADDATVKPVAVPPVNQIRVKNILQNAARVTNILEVSTFLIPQPIQEKKSQRPYLPVMQLWVEQESGLILKQNVTPFENQYHNIHLQLYDFLDKTKVLPAEIWVEKTPVAQILAPICQVLQIELKLAAELPATEEARDHLMKWLNNDSNLPGAV